MRVISFGIYSKRPEYPRQRNLVAGLRHVGAEVSECHFSMASTFRDRLRSASRPSGVALFAARLASSYVVLACRFLRMPPADVILVGHPGYFHVHLARLLRFLKKRDAVIICDVFFSLFDTLVLDRRVFRPGGLRARLVRAIDTLACRAADLCLSDTGAHADYLSEELGVPREKFQPVPVGPLFPPFPVPAPVRSNKSALSVLFVGTYIPLQGADVVLEAARMLSDRPDVSFTLVGTGQLRREIEGRARRWHLGNVEFRDWIPPSGLGDLIRSFDVSLGIFGTTGKAQRVIPHKVFDACSAGVPLITADTPAIREAFCHGENAYLVPSGDPKALASAILALKSSPELRGRLGAGALETARLAFSSERIGKDLGRALPGRPGRTRDVS